MKGFRFISFSPEDEELSIFEKLLKLFLELLTYTSGDVEEAIDWLRELDKQHNLTGPDYSVDQFIEDMSKKGYVKMEKDVFLPTALTEQSLRKLALEQIFGKLKKGGPGQHGTKNTGIGDEFNADLRPYSYGDPMHAIDWTESIRNAQVRSSGSEFNLSEDDLVIHETDSKTETSTVLMIDISHSMILYGEDRITPAKKVAMALAELIRTRFPKDHLDIIVFGNDAWPITLQELPYLQVGPFHTNTKAGLDLALELLRRRKSSNKQIFMITDGKPSCLKEGSEYYMNSFGLDPKIVNKTLEAAAHARKLKIPITTFMIARDPYLKEFVRDFTKVNHGKAYFSSLNGLGEFIFEDYIRNRKKIIR